MTPDEKINKLREMGLFYSTLESVKMVQEDPECDEFDLECEVKGLNLLNLNDTFYWGCADTEMVEGDDEINDLYDLVWKYGYCGMLYWAMKKRNFKETPEFQDAKRAVEFVKNEERIKSNKTNTEYAYHKESYTLGE